ncbi:phosphonate metabolism transcriptional regulator PhnF [Roseovarius autotrophicus]|uniref:phosphonate metabolism transcriptional regulator PhnF n=1 Tax=Roseovarius autotrophicus TaxID=2824121 RepID=UPI001B36F836|nr:phosphonate metabolism transcriptional regulator PhnF [Roseovarius autotrophicus]
MPQLVRQSGLAVWAQIAAALRSEIERGFDEGDWLASEPELAARFGVNRHTLRRAVDDLIAEGLVERVHGRGTRVLARGLIYGIGRDTKFTERLAASGRRAEVTLLDKQEVVADGGVARRLRVAEGAPLLRLRTLRGDGDVPYALTLHFLTGDAAQAARDYTGGSLTRHLRAVAGITLDRIESLITTRLPLPEDALALRMPRTQPVLRVKGVNACRECGLVQEYAISQFRGDRIQLSVAEPVQAAKNPLPDG